MLKNLLNTEVVQVVEQVKDWREAWRFHADR